MKDNKKIFNEFYYLKLYIIGLVSSSLFIIFLILPFDNINSEKIKFIIKNITNFTGGVYYLHRKIKLIIMSLLIKRTIFSCVIIYIICYFICSIGIKIFGKTKLKYLFI